MRSSRKKNHPFGLINKIILGINLFVVLLLGLSYLASVTDPATFWPVAFIGLAYPVLLLSNLIFIIYWLLVRPKIAIISLFAIAIGWKFVLVHIGFREPTGIEVSKSSNSFIRVMTYNIHFFKKIDMQNDKFIKDQMLDIIRREQPDIVCFQEFMTHPSGEFNTEKSVKELLKSRHFYFEPYNDYQYEQIGMAIFSKFPIKDKGRILFQDTDRGNEAMYVDIVFNKKPLRVYNVHFQSIAFQPSDYKYLKNVKDINPNVQSSRLIGSRLKRAFIKRSSQVKTLKTHTEACLSPFLLAGDFNDTPISYALNTMSKGLKNAFHEKGSGFGNTYNGDFPNFQIDYILATPDFEIKNYLIIQKRLSDHYAVRSDVEFLK